VAYEPTIEIYEGYCLVTHESGEGGKREPIEFAGALAEACDSAQIHRVLLDERNLVYTVGNIFELMGIRDRLLED